VGREEGGRGERDHDKDRARTQDMYTRGTEREGWSGGGGTDAFNDKDRARTQGMYKRYKRMHGGAIE
jgi:hypothetical protein